MDVDKKKVQLIKDLLKLTFDCNIGYENIRHVLVNIDSMNSENFYTEILDLIPKEEITNGSLTII